MFENEDFKVGMSMLDNISEQLDTFEWVALSSYSFLGRNPILSTDEMSQITVKVENLLEECEIVEKKMGSDKEVLAFLNYIKGRLYALYWPFKFPRYKSHKKEAIYCYEKAFELTSYDEKKGSCKYYLALLYRAYKEKQLELKNLEEAVSLLTIDDPIGMEAAKELEKLKTKKKGMCFIATAVYGSSSAKEVVVLQSFRDDILVKSMMGRAFITGYYRFSPFYAHLISQSESLKKVMRTIVVAPLVRLAKLLLKKN